MNATMFPVKIGGGVAAQRGSSAYQKYSETVTHEEQRDQLSLCGHQRKYHRSGI